MNDQSNPAARHTLLLRLVGPMQSWGFRSRFDNRDTALEPTRSGVIGLLCAAMGIGRDEPDKLQQFEVIKMGVRVDAPGRVMVDYHTAFEISMQTWRYYLSDARFLVGLESNDVQYLQMLEDALKNPVWPLYLGRRSFVPSLPVHLAPSGLRTGDVENVLKAEPWLQTRHREKPRNPLRLLLETNAPGDGPTMADVPLDFKSRRFGLRHLRADEVRIEKEVPCFSLNSR